MKAQEGSLQVQGTAGAEARVREQEQHLRTGCVVAGRCGLGEQAWKS